MTMRSASRRAADALRAKQHDAIGARTSSAKLTELAGELHSIGTVLSGQPRLRRALGDPATSPERRAELVETLFSAKIGSTALDITKAAVSERWSSPWDLTDALESAGDDALFLAAEKDGALDEVEDDLFRLERILQSEGEITGLLDEQAVDPERRRALMRSLVKGKVREETMVLLDHAVGSQRKRSITLAIDDLIERAAAQQERSVARVVSASPISSAQVERLTVALGEMYGRAITVRTAVDPNMRGGLIVRVGDEVIDGSIATRFAKARTAMGA